MAQPSSQRTVDLPRLAASLRRADPDIRDLVLFGSCAYAPDLAHDVDMVITTHCKKDEDTYWDAVEDFPVDVDFIVREPGQRIGDHIAASLCAWRAVLYGNGETLTEVREQMPVPTFEGVRKLFTRADRLLRSAHGESDATLKYDDYCSAFGKLFDIAREAAQAYLNTDVSRWGELRRSLPSPFDEQFREIINTVHVLYSYDGNYPEDRADEEYQRWREEVMRFVDDLEAERGSV